MEINEFDNTEIIKAVYENVGLISLLDLIKDIDLFIKSLKQDNGILKNDLIENYGGIERKWYGIN